MKTFFNLGVKAFFVLLGLPLLVLADLVFSLAGTSWELKVVALALIFLSSVPFYLVMRKWIEKNGPSELQLMIFSVCWGAFFLLLISGAQSVRQSQGISSYWNRLGNCGALFSPLTGSDWSKSWMDGRRPTFHYAVAVAEDFCRLGRLYRDFSSTDPAICGSLGISDRNNCYRRALEEIMVKQPLTLPGVDVALLEGLALSLKQDQNGTDHLTRMRENFRIAAETFGMVQTTLESFGRRATPESIVGFSKQFKSDDDGTSSTDSEEWDLMKLIYRRHSLSENDEVRFLTEMDQNLENRFVRDIFEKIKHINDRLQADSKSSKVLEDPIIKTYKIQIDQYNRQFSEFEDKSKAS